MSGGQFDFVLRSALVPHGGALSTCGGPDETMNTPNPNNTTAYFARRGRDGEHLTAKIAR